MAPKKRKRLSAEALQAERASLINLRSQVPHVSQSALSAILKIAADQRLPQLMDRKSIRTARDLHVGTQTPYGALHQQITDASGKVFEVQHPFAMLWLACNTSPAISLLVQRLPDSSPAEPLSIVFYADEVSPGNQLSHHNARKSWAFYWSVYQFGPAAMSSDDRSFYVLILMCDSVGQCGCIDSKFKCM